MPLARSRAIELAIGNVPQLSILGDRRRLLQVLNNLVDNALKFAAKAERRSIDIGASATPDGIAFSVRDDRR